jgi:hypothetical protein
MMRRALPVLFALTAACGTSDPATDDGDLIQVDAADSGGNDTNLDVDPGDATVGDAADTDTTEPDTVEPDTGVDASDAEPDAVGDVEPDLPPPPTSCEADADCNDSLACTTDRCVDGLCTWTIPANACLINRVCRTRGEISANDPCVECAPTTSQFAWSPRADESPCEDGDECTVGTFCREGACVGDVVTCDDGNPCTVDSCDGATGCVFAAGNEGASCDDGTACTSDDVCDAGVCIGAAVRCNDGNSCTDDTCDDDLGCVYANRTGSCSDGDACTSGDFCLDGVCVDDGPTNCDDGNTCTIDICDEFAGCSYLPNLNPCCVGTTSICDDLDSCTTDICEPASGSCDYEFNTARCDDGNACTTVDSCSEGECAGRAVVCDDGNPCTTDSCNPRSGCVFTPLTGDACDDGVACTFDDVCSAGRCVAGRDECVCEPTFGLDAVKITALALGTAGAPGQALDLDRNPATCAPSPGCSGGVHNALSPLATFANEPIATAVADGSLMLALDMSNIALNPFVAALHSIELDPANADCDVQAARCSYYVSTSTLDRATCEATVQLPATRSGTTLTAGGPGVIFPLDIPFGDGSTLTLTLYGVRFEGTLVLEAGRVVSLSGVLGGAVPKQQLIDAVQALPADALPVDPATIVGLLNALIQNDIDTNGDGVADAASVGIVLSAIAADLTGVAR